MVGVPLMVMVLVAQEALTPAGNPVALPIPCDPEVVCVMFVKGVLTQTDGVLEAALTVGKLMSIVITSETMQPPAVVTVTVYTPLAVALKATPLVITCGPDHE